ncbi:MAG: MarR family winged helix-turn-helix transcriptional regulator [Polyangiaceae bacterium]
MADSKASRGLRLAARTLGRLGREFARLGKVTPQQAEALGLMLDRGSVSTSSLATLLGIDPSTASRNLAGLERAGFIVRRRGAQDGRQSDVRLTPRGRKVAEAMAAQWSTASVSLLDRAARSERQQLAVALEVLALHLIED